MKRYSASVFTSLLVLMLVVSFLPARPAYAVSPNVVISQVYGGGGNSGATYKNDFIELFNLGSTSVDITDWTVQYASSTGSSWQKTSLTGTLAPGHYYLVREAAGSGGTADLPTPDATGNITMSATDGKVALVSNSTTLTGTCPTGVVDFVGFGSANCSETAPTPRLSNTNAALRKAGGAQDTDNNSADFVVGAPTPHNSSGNPSGYGAANPNGILPGDTTLLTVTVIPGYLPPSTGLAVSCDLSGIGGSATQAFLDDGSNGDITSGDNTFSFSATVDAETSPGDKSLPCSISDAESRTATASISLTLIEILPIGTVNGAVGDADNGTAHRSPYAPPSGNGSSSGYVAVQGVIYEKTLQATAGTSTYKGFFMQNTAATADGDPNTSDGIFVYMSTFTSLIGGYVPQVGDEIVISAKVSEYYNMTELTSAKALRIVRSGVDIETEVAPVVADPPVSLADANRYWERMQGMRIQVPENSIVLGGRNVFSPADAEIWLARADSTIAQRQDPYTRRAFRDAHPLDDNYDPNSWDGNGYRMLIGSLGIKYTESSAQALIDPARTFSTLTNSPVGGLNYTFNKYRVEISEQPTFSEGVDPAANNPPEEFNRDTGYSIVDYNVENLYDYRDNPFSGCDFNNAGNDGCSNAGTPYIDPIEPSYNYVPASEDAYQARLSDIARQIINDLHSPDVLMLQEVENQDICSVSGGAMDCGDTNNADGKPDDLQDLALEIAAQGGPAYDAAFDRDSSDLRGIAPAFMYRTDRVTLAPAAGDPVLGTNPVIGSYTPVQYDNDVSNPKTLNAVYTGPGACETHWVFPRAPDVALFRIYNQSVGVGGWHDVYVINNHFKSGPDSCVAHRTEQANYNAALVAYIQQHNPAARIVMGGDLNVYPEPDSVAFGVPSQLAALYDNALGLKNLWEVLLSEHPESAYSYVYVGMAQTLDQVFVNPLLLGNLDQYRIAHINSDFPADYPGDVARGTSDHDPNMALFSMFHASGLFPPIDALPAFNKVKAGAAVPVKFSLDGDQGLDIFQSGFPRSSKIACDSSEPMDAVEQTLTPGSSGLSYDPLTDTYTYAWKTSASWGGTCRQLTVMLTDGTTWQANFKFTK